ncbi:hypothetical protein TRFO_26020 [Tritrichomonas foetus]|uniref:Uncharacterized protein n=1 Tax=Tritrichomonas foetus TaxID=1144522 RepID=A0A1J4K5F0_9EUKA|nr:hypothetical protein TRFO_26020 [Tritrichomonas foetus]|eukprot:OHT06096.1 hypothetical protein TRFO_26020 [Tritrichomonas foetus]
MAMASKGWCIIYEKLPTIDIVKSLFYSLLFAIPQVLLDNFDFGFIRFVVFGIEMAGMINYYWYLCEASLHALRIIVGHLYVIKEKNINPKSTPIYRNLIIFAFIMIGVLIYIVLVSFSVLIQLADIPYWVDSFINDLITSIFLIFIGFHFRLKSSLKNGYMVMIENVNENEEPQEFTKEQLTEIFNNYKEVLNGTNLNDYSAGDILPPQPIEIKGENEKKGCC